MSEQILNLFWVWNCEMRQLAPSFIPIIAVPTTHCSLAFAALFSLYTSVNSASLHKSKAQVLSIWWGTEHLRSCFQNSFSKMNPRELLSLLLHLLSLQHKHWLCPGCICMSSMLSLCLAVFLQENCLVSEPHLKISSGY